MCVRGGEWGFVKKHRDVSLSVRFLDIPHFFVEHTCHLITDLPASATAWAAKRREIISWATCSLVGGGSCEAEGKAYIRAGCA